MAASTIFTKLTEYLARSQINFGSDTFKAVLVSSPPTEDNLDSWQVLADVANECPETGGYAAGGFPVTATVGAIDSANNLVPVTFAAQNPTYPGSTTISAVGCIIYSVTGGNKVVAYVDFGGLVSSVSGTFSVNFTSPLRIGR